MKASSWIASLALIGVVVAAGFGLAAWKGHDMKISADAAVKMPEPMEVVIIKQATTVPHRMTTNAIGTVLAMQSIVLRNEMPGVVARVDLTPGKVVEKGTELVVLDHSVEQAELKSQEAQASLAAMTLERLKKASASNATSKLELDQAQAEYDVALAHMQRTQAMIDRKMIRATFRARIGLSNLHPGQYLMEGIELTTLQGVDQAVHVDFTVTQNIGLGLREGDEVEILGSDPTAPINASITALDSLINPMTRNAKIRATVKDGRTLPPPGSAVRVRVPLGVSRDVVTIPVNALRRGPEGDHVYVITPDPKGLLRAAVRLVKSGMVVGDEVFIESGLKAGEPIAASGSFKLRDGALVVDGSKAPQKP